MTNTYLILLLIAGCVVAAALLFLKIVRRNSWHDVTEPHNDAIGFVYSSIAVLYAVVLAFTLIAVWERFDAAEAIVNDEANALTDLYIMSATLPEDERIEFHGLLDAYVVRVIDVEWDAMMSPEIFDNCACDEAQAIWSWFLTSDPSLFPNETVYAESLTRLSEFYNFRRTRLNMASGGLADFILVLLTFTAFPTILGPAILGVKSGKVHVLIVTGAAVSISIMVVSVFLINQPFDSQVSVGAEPFHHVLEIAERFRN